MVDPPVSNQTPTHPSRPPCPLPPPRPRPTSTRLGKPAPHLPGRSRKGGPARSVGPPFLQSPGGKPRKHPEAGRRPVALRAETQGAKQMERNTRRETARVVGTAAPADRLLNAAALVRRGPRGHLRACAAGLGRTGASPR